MPTREVEVEITVERTFFVRVRITPEVAQTWHEPGEPGEAEILEVDFNDGLDLLNPGEKAKGPLSIDCLFHSEQMQAIEAATKKIDAMERARHHVEEDDHEHRPF
tara:strand:+ start:242 stop:556 length:315 start_codon:yes stop_codon:yes gene_type:complete